MPHERIREAAGDQLSPIFLFSEYYKFSEKTSETSTKKVSLVI